MSDETLHLMTEDSGFNLELKMNGTSVFFETFTPSQEEIHKFPHIVIYFPYEWNPDTVNVFTQACSYEDKMITNINISSIQCADSTSVMECNDKDIFNISQITKKLLNSTPIKDT